MNSRTTRRALNGDFKKFQRLPDWPFESATMNARRSDATQEKIKAELPLPYKTRIPKTPNAPIAPGFFGTVSVQLPGPWGKGQHLLLVPQE